MNYLSLLLPATMAATRFSGSAHAARKATLFFDARSQPVAFAVSELQQALQDRGYAVEWAELSERGGRRRVRLCGCSSGRVATRRWELH